MEDKTKYLEATHDGIQAAIDAGKAIGCQSITEVTLHGETIPAVVVPAGFHLTTLEKLHEAYRTTPRTLEQNVTATTADDFVEYINRFGNLNTAIFCDLDGAKFRAALDYHAPNAPDWLRHNVRFACKPTPEWQKWQSQSGKVLGQEEFALFLEDQVEYIIDPPGAQMLEIATTLRTKKEIAFESAKRLQDGQTQLRYVEKSEGMAGVAGDLKIPEVFTLGLELFEGAPPYQLQARFRYRTSEGKLRFWYDLIQPHKTVRAAIDDIYKFIEESVQVGIMMRGAC